MDEWIHSSELLVIRLTVRVLVFSFAYDNDRMATEVAGPASRKENPLAHI